MAAEVVESPKIVSSSTGSMLVRRFAFLKMLSCIEEHEVGVVVVEGRDTQSDLVLKRRRDELRFNEGHLSVLRLRMFFLKTMTVFDYMVGPSTVFAKEC
jgi:hypothetical protein